MKKEEIIKSLISGNIVVVDGDKPNGSYLGGKELITRTIPVVDLEKLAKFLSKYVVKDNLIED